MLWFGTTPFEPAVRHLLDTQQIGLMCQPMSNPPIAGWWWAADNGAFGKNYNEEKWLRWLSKDHPRSGCVFAVVPDVVGDHGRTRELWARLHPVVKALRYPVAFVLQDGATSDGVPWQEMDCVFVGGTTEFKYSRTAWSLAEEGKERGLWVHVGRVNSWRRLQYWLPIAHSADGSHISFGPSKNVEDVKRWAARLRQGCPPRLDLP
jgi:hypothetical protein